MRAQFKFGLAYFLPFLLALLLVGCGGNARVNQKIQCVHEPAGSLENYDRLSLQYLDNATRNPPDNFGGNIVWGTRYYLESLLTAYEATENPKYIQSFLQTGTDVMQLVQTLQVLDVPDPSAPGNTRTSPLIHVVGWPTQLDSFSISVPIPTSNGQVSFYAQNLDPSDPAAPVYLNVVPQGAGSLLLNWVRYGPPLLSYTVRTVADLAAIASRPLIWGQSLVRIKSTGLGLPAPGTYQVNTPIVTIWHEQTAGIMLPIAHFLWLAQEHPGLADANIVDEWKTLLLSIAASYENHLLPDGAGGLRFHNLQWLPNSMADTDVAMDYMAAEATLRMFLYRLTGDPHQLALATGLIAHQVKFRWTTSSQGWFLLQYWPDLVPWSTRANAPSGSIWDQFEFDPTTPAPVTDGVFFVDMLHYAKQLGVDQAVGLTSDIYSANQATLQQYLWYGTNGAIGASAPILRVSFPSNGSRSSDGVSPSDNPFAAAGFLVPELADDSLVGATWNWMLNYGQTPQGWPIGYFLRAWARSESAQLASCSNN